MNIKLSNNLAYETGFHVGDGNLYTNNKMYRITYCGNLKNEYYFYKNFLKDLINNLYQKQPLYYERKSDNTVLLILNSKEVFEFKTNFLGLPVGKKDNVFVPAIIKEDKYYIKHFMKGLGDTDFSLSFKKNRKNLYTEPRLEMYTKSRLLIKDVEYILKDLDFTFSVEKQERHPYSGFMLRMYGKKNLENWLKKIGFFNNNIIAKINFWKKFGYFIPKKDYDFYFKSLC